MEDTKINNKSKIKILIELTVSVFFFVSAVVIVLIGDLTRLDIYRTFDVSIDLIGMIIISLLFTGLFFDEFVYGHTNRQYRILLIVNSLALFLELCTWVFDANPNYCRLNEWLNFGYYLCSIFSSAAFWYFMCSELKNTVANKLSPLIEIVCAIGVANLVLNLGVGHIFYIEMSGIYHRSKLYGLSILPPAILITACLLLIVFSKIPIGKKIHYFGYMFFPVIGVFLQNYFFGLSVTYIGLVLTNIIIYLTALSKRGIELVNKEKELNRLREMIDSL